MGPIHWAIGIPAVAGAFAADDSCWRNALPVEICAQGYLEEIRRLERGLVQLHDDDLRTLALLKVILPILKDEGFSFKRVDEIPDIAVALERNGATSTASVATLTAEIRPINLPPD